MRHTVAALLHSRPLLLLSAMGTVLSTTSPARAATDAASEAPAEVIVSATRRNASLEDVPYSISAISGQALTDAHVESLADLTHEIAGVSFVDQGPLSRSNIVLRGMNANGTDHPSVNTIAPVSTYIGDTPIFIPLQIDDLNRVEVLRGPQGTLYGSGSLAGTIRFIPNRPDSSGVHAAVTLDAGQLAVGHDFDEHASGMLNLPLASDLAVRLVAGYNHYAGFINERYIVKLGAPSTAINSPVGIPVPANGSLLGPLVFTPIANANTANQSHVRVSLLYSPDERFSALLAFYHQTDGGAGIQAHSPDFVGKVDTPPSQNPYYSPSYPVSFPTGGTVFPHNRDYDANDSFLLHQNRHTDLGSLELSADLGFATLSSSSSYYRDNGTDVQDNTGLLTLYPAFYGFIPRMVDYQTDTDSTTGVIEELRLVSNAGHRFDYVLGAFYEKLTGRGGQLQWIPGQTSFGTRVGNPGGNAATLGDVNEIQTFHTHFRDIAGFGELTWHVTAPWSVTAGVRQFTQRYELANSTAFPFCGIFCSNNNDPVGFTTTSGGYSVTNHIIKLNSAYRLSESLNVYVNYAEGFRRGGSNAVPISGPFAANPALLVYTPDKSKNYEIGAKGNLGRTRFSGALFYIDWRNFQVDATAVASAAGIAVNGPKARSKGVELELSGPLLLHDLSYTLGYSYADAQVAQDFQVIDFNTAKQAVSIVTGRSGDPLPNAPKHTLTGALDYVHPAPGLSRWELHVHLDESYRSATLSQLLSTDPSAPPPFTIHAFSIWNASLGVSNRSGLTLTAYAQNLFNELGVTGGQDAGAAGPRGAHFFVTRPRTVGLRASYGF